MRYSFLFVLSLALCTLTLFFFNDSSSWNQTIKNTNMAAAEKEQLDGLIPRSVIFGNPDRINVQISPDGTKLAYISSLDGVLNVYVSDSNNVAEAKPVTASKERGIMSYLWSYDNRHIIYFLDSAGDENTGIYVVDISSGEVIASLVKKGVKVNIVAKSYRFPTTLLISTNERRSDFFDIYSFDILTGKSNMLCQNDEYIGFVTDSYLKVRLGGKYTKDRELIFDEVDNSLSKVKPFLKFAADDSDNSGIIGFNSKGDKLYIEDSTGRNTKAIYYIDIASGERHMIASDPSTDSLSLMLNPLTREAEGVIHEYAKPITKFFGDKVKDEYSELCKLLSDNIAIVSRSLDDKIWIIAEHGDAQPAKYYRYNRNSSVAEASIAANTVSRKDLVYLFCSRDALSKYVLNGMHPIEIKARDDLKLLSYLTLPKNVQASFTVDESNGVEVLESIDKKVPTVLLVHGGPTARDYWGLDAQHQWLSNRGYAVLSVNYRGSTGFGKNFIRSGDGEWGRKMHYDLIDAVNWAEKNFSSKTAIMGGSYGGYAALLGLTVTPDVFVCGIDIVGPSNLATLLDTIPPYWEPLKISLVKKIGASTDSQEGREFLASRSPITYAANIKRPLLIAQGANDPRVKQNESEQIVQVMKEKGIPVTYLLYPDEGHGFNRPENKLSFFAIAEMFLNQAFNSSDTSFEPVSDDFKGASMKIMHGKEFISS